jgi:surfeit locus 1 family protein
MLRLMFSRRWWWTTLLVIGAIGVTIRLGIWQIDRHEQHQTFVAHAKAVQAAPPLILGNEAPPPDLSDMEYRAVQASGHYDFEHQVAIRNQVWTQSWGDEVGYTLLTPLVLDDDSAVMVDRGWIPSQAATPDAWRQFDEPGNISVTGVIRLSLEEGEMGSIQDPALAPGQNRLDIWSFVNIPRLQQQVPYPLLPIYIQCAPGESEDTPPYCSLPVLDLSEGTNLGYAIQWFLFSGLLLVGYPVYLRKSESKLPEEHLQT